MAVPNKLMTKECTFCGCKTEDSEEYCEECGTEFELEDEESIGY